MDSLKLGMNQPGFDHRGNIILCMNKLLQITQGSLHFGGPLPVSREALAEAMLKGFSEVMKVHTEAFQPDATLLEAIEQRSCQKYATDQWNARR